MQTWGLDSDNVVPSVRVDVAIKFDFPLSQSYIVVDVGFKDGHVGRGEQVDFGSMK